MQDLIALDAFDILIITSLWIPSDVVIDVDNISALLLLLILKISLPKLIKLLLKRVIGFLLMEAWEIYISIKLI